MKKKFLGLLLSIYVMVSFVTPIMVEASIENLNGDVTGGKKIELTGLDDGYYDLTVICKNTEIDENSYVYGVSKGYSMSSTVLPKSEYGVTVTVKGIGVYGGKCEIGVTPNSKGTVEFSEAKLTSSKSYKFVIGGDMTEVSYIEDLGGEYKDEDGNKIDAFEYLAANGVNMARIRLSNTTGKGTGDGIYYLPEGYQDEEDCLELSKRAKDAGMGIQFTFNYSDYWSNGTRQIIPSAWVKQIKDELGYDVKDPAFLKSMTAEQKKQIQDKLVTIIYDYTYDIMTKLKNQGTVPEYVSLGNEINGGMLFPFGNAYAANMSMTKKPFELVWGDDCDADNDIPCAKELDYLKKFLKSGYDAVKAVSPETQVIVHFATDGNNGAINDGKYTWLMDEAVKAGAVDVLGASYYPAWSNSVASKAAEFCERMYAMYNKPVMIMETGFNWNPTKKNGYAGQLVDIDAYKDIYPASIDGHKGYMAELFNELKGAGDSCVGVLYWDPCMIHVEDSANPNESLSGWAYKEEDDLPDGNAVENTTLFDFDGKAIPSVIVFKNTRESAIYQQPTETAMPTPTVTPELPSDLKIKGVIRQNHIISDIVVTGNAYTQNGIGIVAVYNSEGVLKRFETTVSNSVTEEGTYRLNNSVAYENTDTYKVFVWDGLDIMKPLTEVFESIVYDYSIFSNEKKV